MLDNTQDADDTDDTERNHGQLLGKLIHTELQRRPLLFDLKQGRSVAVHDMKKSSAHLLHHREDHAKLGLCTSRNHDTRASA